MDLLANFTHVQKGGAGWTARCPSHPDQRNSLSISQGDRQPWVLRCHAGCSTEAIVTAAGLTMQDLLEPRQDVSKPTITATYDYVDEHGSLLFQALRYSPKDFRQRRPDGSGGWIWNLQDVTRVLFGLPELRRQSIVYIPEGEKDVLALRSIGLSATCNAGGAGKWRDAYVEQLVKAGVQHVVVLPDNDPVGRSHSEVVAHACTAAGLKVKVVDLPDLPHKGDVSDWLAAGHTTDELIAIVKATPIYTGAAEPTLTSTEPPTDLTPTPPVTRTAEKSSRESQASAIVRLVRESGAELWSTPAGGSYISAPINTHLEHYPLTSRASKDYLSRLYYLSEAKAPNASALADAINTLSGGARFDGEQHQVHVRVAGQDDRIYLDLCDQEWRAVEVTQDGWQVVHRPDVRFRRSKGMLPLPVPEQGGTIDDLRRFVNLATVEDFVLTVSWLVQALRPTGPYPVAIVLGEQGSCKSTFCRVLRRLIDPNIADTRSEPRDVRDLAIAADNGFVVSFDNLSRLPEWLSDALCRLATGGGFATRTLFENREEEIFDAQRPTILNGISQVATRADLVDRAIVLSLPTVPDRTRRTEASFWRAFEETRPRMLGALLDAVVVALRRHAQVQLTHHPRMADFAVWSIAAEPAFPWSTGSFEAAYSANREGAVDDVLDGNVLVDVTRTIAPWEGTASELLTTLNQKAPEDVKRQKGWFTKPRQVANELRRIAPALRRTGVDVTFTRNGHTRTRLIEIRVIPSSASSASSASAGLLADSPIPADGRADDARTHPDPSSAASSAPIFEIPNDFHLADDADAADAAMPLYTGRAQERL